MLTFHKLLFVFQISKNNVSPVDAGAFKGTRIHPEEEDAGGSLCAYDLGD